MRGSIAAAFALFILCLVGCQQPVTEGGKVNPRPVHRIVSLSPGTSELVNLLMAADIEFVGRTSSCNFPEGVVDQIPIVADVKPNYEKVALAQPDLIVFDKSLYSDSDIAQINRATKAIVMPMEVTTLDQFNDFVNRLGSASGNETATSQYLDKIYAVRARVTGGLPAVKPKVLMMLGGQGTVYVAGQESFNADLIRVAGGEPVGPAGTKFMPVEPEALATLNADAIVCTVPKSQITSDPRFKFMPAVQTGRIYSLKPDVVQRIGVRVDTLLDDLGKIVTATANQLKQ